MVWLNLAVISGAWGSSFLFVKLISVSVSPFAFAFARGAIAALALFAWLVIRAMRQPLPGLPLPTRRDLRHMVVLGTTNGWFANVTTAVAVAHAESATVAMLQATVPVMVAVLAHFIFVNERLQLRQGLGIAAGMVGAVLILSPSTGAEQAVSGIGITAMLLTALSFALGTIYARRISPRDPVMLAAGQQGFGALVAGLISAFFEAPQLLQTAPHIWMLLVVVGVLCSALPTALYLRLLARATAVSAALVAYLQPVWAALLGWIVLSEQIRGAAVIGTALVLLGVFTCTSRQSRG